jgi:uncharacterized protein (TIGR03437 family)
LLASALAHAQSYTFIRFDVPNSNGTFPAGINNSGQIVGNYSDNANNSHAFLRSADGTTFMTIAAPGALPFTTKANGINNLGQVVGSYMDATGFHGYIRNADGEFTMFGITSLIPLPGPNADASAINDYGEVVGPASDLVTGSNGYMRSADGAELTLVQAPFLGDTSPAAINNSGEIAGFGLDGGSTGTQHGFLRSPGGSYAPFDLPGTTSYTRILGINSAGKFAGEFGMNMGFVSNDDGSFALLGGYPVSAINDAGDITGNYYTGTPPTHGFIGVPGATDTRPAIRTLLPGVLTASGFGGATTIAPGTWIEIYGNNLAPTARSWRASDFIGNTAPTSLESVKVSVNGSPTNISYISPGQVNAFVPTTVPGAAMAQVTVTSGADTSLPYEVFMVASQPEMLTLPPDIFPNQSYLAAVFPDFVTYVLPPYPSYANVPTRRAKAGDTIVLFGTGLGPVSPGVPVGQIATEPSRLTSALTVSFTGYGGTVFGTVTYAGVVPGTLGLYQVNVVVPEISLPPEETFDDGVSVQVLVDRFSAQANSPHPGLLLAITL